MHVRVTLSFSFFLFITHQPTGHGSESTMRTRDRNKKIESWMGVGSSSLSARRPGRQDAFFVPTQGGSMRFFYLF